MAVYRIREFLTNPNYRRKVEKASSPVRSEVDLTASERAYMNQQEFQTSYTQQRFLAEQQLSVRDYLKNRPSLRRNYSVPANLDVSRKFEDTKPEFEERGKRRSQSHGESFRRDFEDLVEESSRFSASQSLSMRYSTSTPQTNGFHRQEMGKTGEHTNGEIAHEAAPVQTHLHPISSEGDDRGSTPFLTPETSTDEVSTATSHYYSPLNSQDNLSSDGEQIELPSMHTVSQELIEQAEVSAMQHPSGDDPTDMDTTLKDSCAQVNDSAALDTDL